jgi:hypothetical protein
MVLEYANYKDGKLTINPARLADTFSVDLVDLMESAKNRKGEALSAPIETEEDRSAVVALGDEVNNG